MIDIWKYANTLPSVILTAVDGQVFRGNIIDVEDAEENDGDPGDNLVLETEDRKIIGFLPEEIASIEVIE